jgi:magnesium-transporting ATPase (P-type)
VTSIGSDYIINFALILASWVAVLGLQFSIIVFHYSAERKTTEKQILENKCSELQRYDQTDYYTQHNHYQTFRKCEITFLSLATFLNTFMLILKLVATVNGSCINDYGGWRTGIELIVIILFSSLNLTYYMKGVGKREECKKLKSINDKTISLTPSKENQKQVDNFI